MAHTHPIRHSELQPSGYRTRLSHLFFVFMRSGSRSQPTTFCSCTDVLVPVEACSLVWLRQLGGGYWTGPPGSSRAVRGLCCIKFVIDMKVLLLVFSISLLLTAQGTEPSKGVVPTWNGRQVALQGLCFGQLQCVTPCWSYKPVI